MTMCANNRCVQDLLSLAHDLVDLTPAYSGIRKRAEAVLAANGLPLQREEAGGDRDVRLTPAMIQHLAQVSAENPGTDLILRPDAPSGEDPVSVSVFAPAEPPPRDERFERWCARVGYSTDRRPSGSYKDVDTEAVWSAWQAAIAANRILMDEGGAWRMVLDTVTEVAGGEFEAVSGTNLDRVLDVIRRLAKRPPHGAA